METRHGDKPPFGGWAHDSDSDEGAGLAEDEVDDVAQFPANNPAEENIFREREREREIPCVPCLPSNHYASARHKE